MDPQHQDLAHPEPPRHHDPNKPEQCVSGCVCRGLSVPPPCPRAPPELRPASSLPCRTQTHPPSLPPSIPPPPPGVPGPIVDRGAVLGAAALLPPPLGYLCCDSVPCLETSKPFPAPTPRARPAPPPPGSGQSKTYPQNPVCSPTHGTTGHRDPRGRWRGSPCAQSAPCRPRCGAAGSIPAGKPRPWRTPGAGAAALISPGSREQEARPRAG